MWACHPSGAILPARRRRTAWFLAALVCLLPLLVTPCRADTIYLKNGRTIVAATTRDDGKRVYYESGGGEYSIPRSLVDRIEKSDPSPAETATDSGTSQTTSKRSVPLPTLPGVGSEPGADSPVIKNDAVNEVYLQKLSEEARHDPTVDNQQRLKRAYQEAAVFLMRKGDAENAIAKYQEALKRVPNDLTLTLGLGYLQVTQNHHLEAMELLLPAADRYPKSADLHLLLGSAFYGMENLDQAIAEWNKALAIHDNPNLREAVARAERERNVAGSYLELRSEHFLLRYESPEVEALSEKILSALESAFRDLVLDLDFYPNETIVVLLYPNQAFRDITRSPSWVGAINDGKIRVPVSGLTVMTPELSRVLKHELTHSFVRQITLGRCPVWFNEGLAQLEEGASTATQGSQLARAFAGGQLPSYAALEGSFVSLPADQAAAAYAQSLAALEYLNQTFGMGEIRRLLKAMPSTPDFGSLLQEELRLTYPALEQDVAAYLSKRYGP